MTRETLEELRERLLRQHSVQRMIQVRAYEIFQMRGGQPGGEAQDWFHAEGEVLAFLIASESVKTDEQAEAESAGGAHALGTPAEAPTAKKTKPRARAKPADAKQASTKKTATKRATTRKSAESKPKAKTPGKPKAEESSQ